MVVVTVVVVVVVVVAGGMVVAAVAQFKARIPSIPMSKYICVYPATGLFVNRNTPINTMTRCY